jgi:beta-N-acetylhexosaminidase
MRTRHLRSKVEPAASPRRSRTRDDGIDAKFRSLLVVDIHPEEQLEAFAAMQPGGIVVRRRHTRDPAQVRELICRHQALAELPLLVAGNFEWGVANDVRGCRSFFPGVLALAAACGDDLSLAQAQAEAIGREARSLGINAVFGPAIDVIQGESTEVGTRGFSRDPGRVAAYADRYIRGLQAGGVAAVGKHFPGGGAGKVDSHLGLPVLKETWEDLQRCNLKPFIAAIAAGVGGLMTSHNAYPAINGDRCPGTMSARLAQLLRTELGFEGFLITDNMGMGATAKHFPPSELLLGPLRGGHDLVLVRSEIVNPRLLAECGEIIRQEPALQERIEVAFDRMTGIRRRWRMGMSTGSHARFEEASRVLGEEISRKAIAVLRDPAHLLRDGFHIALPSNFGYLAMELKRHILEAELVFPADSPSAEEQAAILAKAKQVQVVVLEMHDEQSLTGLAAGQIQLCRRLMRSCGDKLVIAGLYSPQFLERLPPIGAAVFAFSAMPASQVALARVLLGTGTAGGNSSPLNPNNARPARRAQKKETKLR